MNRRQFLAGSALGVAGALGIGVFVLPASDGPRVVIDRFDDNSLVVLKPNAWIRLFSDNRIVLVLARNEMGQGVYTTHPTLIAEELGVSPTTIEVEFAIVDDVYDDPSLGVQLTGGSRSTKGAFEPLRKLGAAVREALTEAAAQILGVSIGDIRQEDRTFFDSADPTRQVTMGNLLEVAAELVTSEGTPKPPEDWTWLGKPQPRLDTPAKVFGEATFGLDVSMSGLRYASLWRRLRSADAARAVTRLKADAGPGLEVIEPSALAEIDPTHSTIAVVGPNTWEPMSLLKTAQASWGASMLGGNNDWSTESIAASMESGLNGDDIANARNDGDFSAADSDRTINAAFRFPYLPHMTMEPMNCTAWVKSASDNRDTTAIVEIWIPTQAPYGSLRRAAALVGVDEDRVRFHQTFIGGGFGRRVDMDFVVEAVVVSKILGAPVKVTWMPEDDHRHGRFRPGSHHTASVKLNQRKIVGWHHRIASQSVMSQFMSGFIADTTPWLPEFVGDAAAWLADLGLFPADMVVQTAKDMPYAVDNVLVEHAHIDTGIPVGFWRANSSSTNAFVIETLIDEIAEAFGEDPIEFRRGLLKEHPEYSATLDALIGLVDAAGAVPAGRARGMAIVKCYETVVAMITEVSVSDTLRPRIHRVFVGVDCGTPLNPNIIEQQIESSVVWGISAALHGDLKWAAGIPQSSNFHDHEVLRLPETPEIMVAIVPSTRPPVGIGEPAVPAVAPAVANAYRRLGLPPIRELPINVS